MSTTNKVISGSVVPPGSGVALRTGLIGALIAMSLGLSGCWEEVTEHTPGVYSGKSDELTSDADAVASRSETLAKRFQLVQTDR